MSGLPPKVAAVTVSWVVPVGVPGFAGVLLLPLLPHDIHIKHRPMIIMNVSERFGLSMPAYSRPRKPGNNVAKNNVFSRCNGIPCKRALGAVVVMVSLAPWAFCAKEQLASDGRPEHLNETGWLKPPSGVSVSMVLPLRPGALTVTLLGFAARTKSWFVTELQLEIS
jgi:hypothetical protein